MSRIIAQNTAAASALRYLNMNAEGQAMSLAKLASGSQAGASWDSSANQSLESRMQSREAHQAASQAAQAQETGTGSIVNTTDALKNATNDSSAAFNEAMAQGQARLATGLMQSQAPMAPLAQANPMPGELLRLLR